MRVSSGLAITFSIAAWAVTDVTDAFAPQRFAARNAVPVSSRRASSTSTALYEGPLDILGGIGETLGKEVGSFFSPKVTIAKEDDPKPQLPDVVIDPNYTLAAIFFVLGVLLDLIPYIQLTLGPLVTLLGILFLVQTYRIRFCFDSTAFELLEIDSKDDLKSAGENIVVGGRNRWDYTSFVNYEFYPEEWVDQPQGPILVYFKETQTPEELWDQGPGKSGNSPEALAKGAKRGQIHFFPALCDCKQLRAEFERRGCAKL